MIPNLEISIDTRKAEALLTEVEKNQIPFALSLAMNRAMNDAQRAVRGGAYSKVFSTRNRSLAKALTTIPREHRATKHRLHVTMMNVRDNRTGRMAGEGFINRQIEGRVKTPRGRNIAIPQVGPGLRRLKGGSIPAAKKPAAMGDKLVRIRGGLYQKKANGKLVKRYVLTKRAKPNRRGRFRYYETGTKVIMRTIQSHWDTAITKALRTAR